MAHRQQPSQQTLTNYIDSHNAYVQQLHTTNAMLEWYNIDTIPQLMQELEDIYSDLCGIVSEAIFNGADIISAKVIMDSIYFFPFSLFPFLLFFHRHIWVLHVKCTAKLRVDWNATVQNGKKKNVKPISQRKRRKKPNTKQIYGWPFIIVHSCARLRYHRQSYTHHFNLNTMIWCILSFSRCSNIIHVSSLQHIYIFRRIHLFQIKWIYPE